MISAKEEAIQSQNFEKAAKLRDEERAAKAELKAEKDKWKEENNKKIRTISKEDIAEAVANWTGIPVQKISENENERLKNLEKSLHQRVIGQEEAVSAVAKAIKRGRVGLKDPKRPIGSFLFLGPTGVGKTELSKALAESLFGDENSIIRVDMSEYMESHSTSKMIGSPPGYVGFDEGGGLTEKIRRKPYSVILFDEIEKAHPDVLNMLLQILDDGRLTDSHGRVVDFKNTVIIMTSNIGARKITEQKSLGFIKEEDKEKEYNIIKNEVMSELKKNFRPELLNRIDEIIVFHKLTEEELEKIADIMISEVIKRMSEQNIQIKVDKKVKQYIVKNGTDTTYGARPRRRAIQNILEDKLAEDILDGKIKEGDKVTLTIKDDKLVYVSK